jgi:hypothetical protein
MPGHGRAPVVARDHRGFLGTRADQAHHVADEMQERVGLD